MKTFLKNITHLLHNIQRNHDHYTAKHETMTGKLMANFSKALGYDAQEARKFFILGNIHDIGKIAIPVTILEKHGSLSAFERSVMRKHPEIGYKFIDKLRHPFTAVAQKVILNHHEAFDGSGYPNGLKGSAIPIEARICSICDVYEALRAYRPYRDKNLGHAETVEKMLDQSHGMKNKFDPDLLKVFENISDQMRTWFDEGVAPIADG